jgi:hypothetical protein
MPIDRRRDPKIIAVLFADVIGPIEAAAGEPFAATLRAAADRLNDVFAPALAEPFLHTAGDRIEGALADPAQAPLCLSVMRETLAPTQLRAGIGIGSVERAGNPGAGAYDAYEIARRAQLLAARDNGLTRYLGTGEAGDVLLTAICRLVDPLIRARTPKQWEAISAYRSLGHQREVALALNVTRQSVGDRLSAGHRRAVEEADAAIATFLSHIHRQRPPF